MGVFKVENESAKLTDTQVNNSLANTYNDSPEFQKMADYFAKHPHHHIIVEVYDPADTALYDMTPTDPNVPSSPWREAVAPETIIQSNNPNNPSEGATITIRIPTSSINGDTIGGELNSLPRAVAGQLAQAYERAKHFDQKGGMGLSGDIDQDYGPADYNADAVRDAENKVGQQALGEPADLRTSGMLPVFNYGDGNFIIDPVVPNDQTPEGGNHNPWHKLTAEDAEAAAKAAALAGILAAAAGGPSPLVLDLDASGTIDLTDVTGTGTTYFNFNPNDQFAEKTGWVTGGDGILAVDVNGDGIINHGGELFGDQTGYDNGFLALGAHDGNADGVISAEDQIWNDLRVWVDANHNGYSEEGELHTLDSLGITSIATGYTDVNYQIAGNDVRQEGTFTMNGVTHDLVDVYFVTNPSASYFDGDYTPDPYAYELINVRGTGYLADLRAAMSMDNDRADADSLISKVTDFVGMGMNDVFAADTAALDAVRDILYRWAGVDDVDPASRGPHVDARQLEFLETMTATQFLQQGYLTDPRVNAGAMVTEAFISAENFYFAVMAAQTDAGALLSGDFYYNTVKGGFQGITGIDLAVLGSLETTAAALNTTAEKDVFWQNVVRLVEYTVGTANLNATEAAALSDAIVNSDAALNLNDILVTLLGEIHSNDINGTSGADTLGGTVGNDSMAGFESDDVLNGGLGNDTLLGGAGADTLAGGYGDDYLQGGAGNDTYVYNLGDGTDIIDDDATSGSASDVIQLGAGIDQSHVSFVRGGQYDLEIHIDTGTQTGMIAISNQFTSIGAIETLAFSGGATLDLTSLNYVLTGTDGHDTLYGVEQAGGAADTIFGGAGRDTIYGYDGADTLDGGIDDDMLYGRQGNDILKGGAGNDLLDGYDGDDVLDGGTGNDKAVGGTGNDSYYYTSGHDVYVEASGTDAIYLDAAYSAANTSYYRIDGDLKIVFDNNNDITISRFFDSSSYRIETLHFATGAPVTLATVNYQLQGGAGDDVLIGTSGANVFYGMGGNDVLDGGSGDDTLYGGAANDYIEGDNGDDYLDGGAGDDTLIGGDGNDTYIYVSGHDVFAETLSDTDTIKITSGWTFEDMTFRRYITDIYDLVIGINAANSIRLDNYFQSSSRAFEYLITSDLSSYTLTDMAFETHGTAGADVINGITVNAQTHDTIYGFGGDDRLNGGAGNDTLYGGDGSDELDGGNNDDYLDGGAGNDYLEGRSGNDTYYYESGVDAVRESSGNDTLLMGGGVTINDITTAKVGNHAVITVDAGVNELTLELQHYSSSYRVETIAFKDGFTADMTDHLNWLWGSDSADTITGTSGADTIIGKDGDDTLSGAGGADHMHGGSGHDVLHGGDGSDFLHGGFGDDIIFGDAGADVLFGGAGADTFSFEASSAYSGADTIRDFSTTDGDVIDIADVLDGIYDPLADSLLDFVQVTQNGSDTTISIDRDGAGTTWGWTQIATLAVITGLGDADTMVAAGTMTAV